MTLRLLYYFICDPSISALIGWIKAILASDWKICGSGKLSQNRRSTDSDPSTALCRSRKPSIQFKVSFQGWRKQSNF